MLCETPCTYTRVQYRRILYSAAHTRALCSRYRARSIDAMSCAGSRVRDLIETSRISSLSPASVLPQIFTSHATRGPIITQPPYTSKLYIYVVVRKSSLIVIYILYTSEIWLDDGGVAVLLGRPNIMANCMYTYILCILTEVQYNIK